MKFKYVRTIVATLLIFLSPVLNSTGAANSDMSTFRERAEKAVNENDIPMAIGMYSQLLKDYKATTPKKEQSQYAEDFMKAYELCMSQNRFLEAFEFATCGLQAAHSSGEPLIEIRFLGSIGNIHSIFDDYERAIYYYKRGYRMALDSNYPDMQWKFLLSLIPPSLAIGETARAKEYFNKLSLVTPPDSVLAVFSNEYLQGIIASSSKLPEMAKYFHKRALTVAQNNAMNDYIVNELWEIGKTFYDTEQLDSARYYYNRAADEAIKSKNTARLANIYLSLARLSQLEGDTAGYVKYSNMEKKATEAFFSRRTFNSKRNQLLEYEEMVKDTSIEDLNRKVLIQNTVLISGSIILIIILIFYVLLRKRIKELRYANNKLIDRNRELREVEEQNRKLMDKQLAATTEDIPEKEIIEEENNPMTRTTYLSKEQTEILLSRIRKVLNETDQPFNAEFSLNTLAQIVKSNTKYVSWVINETYGKNFKAILNELRVRKASGMLEDRENFGNLTIQAIAEEVGYKSSTSFIIAFKKLVGMTPSVYQKLAFERQEGTDSTLSTEE